jgi:hypothetical protein
VGAVHLDGGGEVGQRGAGAALRLGDGHDREAHRRDGVPQAIVEPDRLELPHPLAVRLLVVEALAGLAEGVLVGGEGEVHAGRGSFGSRF